MEMCCSLMTESTVIRTTVLGGSEALKTFLNNCRVFTMIIGMHLNVTRADVDFFTGVLEAYLRTFRFQHSKCVCIIPDNY